VGVRLSDITTRRLLYWLAALVALLVVGTTIGLIWADTSDAAGAFAGVTNLVSVVGIVILLIVLVFRHTRPNDKAPSSESPK
jgi:multisubunit Na+/H+ antiporter MnhB subunit